MLPGMPLPKAQAIIVVTPSSEVTSDHAAKGQLQLVLIVIEHSRCPHRYSLDGAQLVIVIGVVHRIVDLVSRTIV